MFGIEETTLVLSEFDIAMQVYYKVRNRRWTTDKQYNNNKENDK
jgi:hypothetical protein